MTTWQQFDDLGIDVLAMRDTTRLGDVAPECLERTDMDAQACGQSRTARLREESPVLEVESLPGNVRPMDVTDYICESQWCPAVQGNQFANR